YGNGGDDEHHADDTETVAETHDQSLAMDGIADGHDCLVVCECHIGNAVRKEVIGQIRDAVPGRFEIERHRMADDCGMILIDVCDDGADDGGANGAAQIAQHVREAGSSACILWRDSPGGDDAKGRDHHSLAHGAQDIGEEELVTCHIEGQGKVHEAADGK